MKMRMLWTLIVIACFAGGCASRSYKNSSGAPVASASGKVEDDPRISRSAGEEGGVVVLWPRIIGRSEEGRSEDIAAALQQRLREVVARALPGRPVDVRPEPERVCPQGGCRTVNVGVLLLREQAGCAVLALVGGAGRSAISIVPWAGDVELRSATVPFRDPPEDEVRVKDFTPCGEILGALSQREAEVEAAIRAAAH